MGRECSKREIPISSRPAAHGRTCCNAASSIIPTRHCISDFPLSVKLHIWAALLKNHPDEGLKRLEILGITVDLTLMRLYLPDNKIQGIQSILHAWKKKNGNQERSTVTSRKTAACCNSSEARKVFCTPHLWLVKGGPNQRMRLNWQVRSDI